MLDGNWQWGDCELGAMCHELDSDTMQGTCKASCTGSEEAPICAEGTACVRWGSGWIDLHLCEPVCDPLATDACATGDTCVYSFSGSSFVCVPDASGAGGAQYSACEWQNACDPGLTCIDATYVPGCDPGDPYCCTHYCDLGQPMCPDALECLPWFTRGTAPAGDEDVGFCATNP